jgi:hypothetical protein
VLGLKKSSTYSSEYASGFSRPAASHLAAPPSPRHEGNVGQAPSNNGSCFNLMQAIYASIAQATWLRADMNFDYINIAALCSGTRTPLPKPFRHAPSALKPTGCVTVACFHNPFQLLFATIVVNGR